MKFVLILVIVVITSNVFGQIDTVAVGDSAIVYLYKKGEMHTCSTYKDTCYFVTFGASALKAPFFNSHPKGISFKPTSNGVFVDTCTVGSGWVYNRPPLCNWTPCYNSREQTNDTVIVKGIAYYDNSIKLRVHSKPSDSPIVFVPDSTRFVYEQTKLAITIYNNRPERVIFKNWAVVADTTFHMSVSVATESEVDSFAVEAHSFIHATLLFSTDVTPQLISQACNAELLMPCSSSNADTLFSSKLEFIFQSKPLFKKENKDKYQLLIFPNPGPTATISCYIPLTEYGPVSLGVFDVLGNKVLNLWDGVMKYGENSFSADLPIGIYFVRFSTRLGTQIHNLISTQ